MTRCAGDADPGALAREMRLAHWRSWRRGFGVPSLKEERVFPERNARHLQVLDRQQAVIARAVALLERTEERLRASGKALATQRSPLPDDLADGDRPIEQVGEHRR